MNGGTIGKENTKPIIFMNVKQATYTTTFKRRSDLCKLGVHSLRTRHRFISWIRGNSLNRVLLLTDNSEEDPLLRFVDNLVATGIVQVRFRQKKYGLGRRATVTKKG